MLKIDNESYIYKKFFLDNNFLVFQKDNSKEKIVLVNETNFKNKIFFSLEDIKEHLYNTYEKPKIIQAQLKKSASERNKKDMKLFIFIVLFIFLLISINIILLFLLGLLISDPYLVNVYDSDLPNYSFLRKYFTIPIHLISIPITYIIIKKILK
jgi:nitrate reductase NapE component